MPTLAIDLVPCLRDNYAYLVRDSAAGLCAVVDPSEAAPVRAALAKAGARLTHILNTHHHFDHTGGNLELKAEFGAEIVGPAKDRDRIPGIDVGVDESAPWNFGPHAASVLEIPAHTHAHIAFHFPDSAAVFTGRHAVRYGLRAAVRGYTRHDVGRDGKADGAAGRDPRLLRP